MVIFVTAPDDQSGEIIAAEDAELLAYSVTRRWWSWKNELKQWTSVGVHLRSGSVHEAYWHIAE